MTTAAPKPSDEDAEYEALLDAEERYFEQKHAIDDFGRYLATRNARFAWRAYSGFRRAGVAIPEGLLQVFDCWASALGSAQDDRSTLRAVELGGDRKRHLGAKRVGSFERDTVIAAMVVDAMKRWNLSPTKAIERVARNNPPGGWLTHSAVKAAYYSAARKALPIVKDH